MGGLDSIRQDFKEAIQDAYDQGLVSWKAVVEGGYSLKQRDGQGIEFHKFVDDAYIICLTGDHYPAAATQLETYLEKKDIDPYPIAISIFDLDILSFYLPEPVDFLYYLRQRSAYIGYFKSDSEMSFLGFHILNRLHPVVNSSYYHIPAQYAQLIDEHYPVDKQLYANTGAADRGFHECRNATFERLIDELKNVREHRLTDVLFFLYDLTRSEIDELILGIQELIRATLDDGNVHERLFRLGDERGILFVSYPQTFDDVEEQLLNLARVVKRRDNITKLLALSYISGTPRMISNLCFG